MAQEALTNVARHSHAKHAVITLRREDQRVALEIQDDGMGFDMNAVEARMGRGLGLAGMRERRALIGGSLSILSSTGNGTRVVGIAPLESE